MKIKRCTINKKINEVIIYLYFIVLLFIHNSEKMSYQGDIFVRYIVGNKSLYIMIIGIIGFLFFLFSKVNKKIKIDDISILLFLRFLFFIIENTIIYILGTVNTEFQTGIILAYLMSFCFYLIGKSENNKKLLSNLCFLSSIIIVVQLILTFIGENLSYTSDLKWWMVIPIGQTNTIGCYLIGMLMYVYCFENNSKKKNIMSIVSLIGIILTYSRSGLIMYMIFIIFTLINKLKSKNQNVKIRTILKTLILICFAAIFIINNINFFDRFSVDNLSSSRLKVYKEGIALFSDHILFGIGAYSYHIYDAVKAHNWILESLIETGTIGSILFYILIYKVYKKIKLNSKIMIPFFSIYLIHGLVEPNLFTVSFDSFFWLLIGSCLFVNKNEYE